MKKVKIKTIKQLLGKEVIVAGIISGLVVSFFSFVLYQSFFTKNVRIQQQLELRKDIVKMQYLFLQRMKRLTELGLLVTEIVFIDNYRLGRVSMGKGEIHEIIASDIEDSASFFDFIYRDSPLFKLEDTIKVYPHRITNVETAHGVKWIATHTEKGIKWNKEYFLIPEEEIVTEETEFRIISIAYDTTLRKEWYNLLDEIRLGRDKIDIYLYKQLNKIDEFFTKHNLPVKRTIKDAGFK